MNFSNACLLRRFESLKKEKDGSSQEVPTSRATILVAESDPAELNHIASLLRNLDFSVFTAGDGETALKLAREHLPHLVLSSMQLPKIDGYKFCQALRDGKETEAIPFMFVLEDGEFPDHLVGHESFAHDYIQKPISVSELKNRIQSLLNLLSSEVPFPVSMSELDEWEEESLNSESEPNLSELKLCNRLRELLNEATSCLDDLEYLVTGSCASEGGDDVAGSEKHAVPASQTLTESESVEAPRVTTGEKDTSQVERYLSEYQERIRTGRSPFPLEGQGSESVEDIFSEFFEMETAARAGTQDDPPEEDLNDARQLYEDAISYVMESIRGVASGTLPDIFRGAEIAERIVDCLEESSSLIMAATDRGQDYSVSRHSTNVAVFAARVAKSLSRDLQCQREVCLAGLLHELGVAELPANLIHREGSLTSEEFQLIRRRPIQSSSVIRSIGPEYSWLAEITRQVNERENGTGGPMGLVGEEIDERAKIIGISDVFDSCIHNRPYRRPVTGYQALFELTTDQQRVFSDQMVKALIQSFSLYPFNECVRLSTGEIGKVVDINAENLSRPVVEILADREGKVLEDPRTIDLGRESTLYIAETLAVEHCL